MFCIHDVLEVFSDFRQQRNSKHVWTLNTCCLWSTQSEHSWPQLPAPDSCPYWPHHDTSLLGPGVNVLPLCRRLVSQNTLVLSSYYAERWHICHSCVIVHDTPRLNLIIVVYVHHPHSTAVRGQLCWFSQSKVCILAFSSRVGWSLRA